MVIARSLTDVVDQEIEGAKFQLRMLPHRTMLRLADLNDSSRVELLIRSGVAGWSGIFDAEGKDVECKNCTAIIEGISVHGAMTVDSFEVLPFGLLGELSTAILQANNLADEEVGN